MRPKHGVMVAVMTAVLLAGALGAWQFIRPFWPAVGPVASGEPMPEGPLKTADGWVSSLVVDHLPGARDMALDWQGNLWVSQPGEGRVALVELGSGGSADNVSWPLRGLRKPHGLAFDPKNPS